MAAGKLPTYFSPHLIGSNSSRTGAPFSVRVSARSSGFLARAERGSLSTLDEAPSCIFVGPIETANKETLEALYSQEDPSQVFALASVWLLLLGIGCTACLVPLIYTITQSYQDAFSSGFTYSSQASAMDSLAMLNGMLFTVLGSMIGYPVASASVGALRGLWKNDLVALKGACPNCGEEVFAFVRSSQSNNSPHRADCHVCDCSLEFRAKVEQSISSPGRRWVYGRIYLKRQRGRSRRQVHT